MRSRPNALSAGVLISPFLLPGAFLAGFRDGRFLAGEIRVQLLQNFLARLLDVHVEAPQNSRRHAVAFAQETEQNVLRADVSMIQVLGLPFGQVQHLLHARRVGNVADHLLVGAGADLLLDFHADGFEVEAHLLEDIHRHALAQFDQAEQKMLGAEKVVVKPVGFLSRQREHLLGARRKITHGFIAHTRSIVLRIGGFVQSRPAFFRVWPADASSTGHAPCLPAASRVPRPTVYPKIASANGPAASR